MSEPAEDARATPPPSAEPTKEAEAEHAAHGVAGEHEVGGGDKETLADAAAAERLSSPGMLTPRQQYMQVGYLAVSFCVLFVSFNTTQSFLTTFFPTAGFYSLFLIYTGFAVGSVLAVPLGHYVRSTRLILVGALGYLALIAVINPGNIPLFLFFSLVNGLSGGLLWVNQGLYIVRASEAGEVSIGRLTGLFYTIWGFNAAVGSLIVIVSVQAGVSNTGVMWVMLSVAAVACFMLLFVQPVPAARRLGDAPTLGAVVRNMIRSAPRTPLFFVSYCVQQGMNLTLSFAVLPTLVSTRLDEISIVFLGYAAASTVAGLLWGQVFDKGGYKALFLGHALAAVCVVVAIVSITATGSPWQLHIITGVFCALVDQGNNAIAPIIITTKLSNMADVAFSIFRVIFSISTALMALVALYIPYYATAGACLFMVFVSFALYLTTGAATAHGKHPPGDGDAGNHNSSGNSSGNSHADHIPLVDSPAAAENESGALAAIVVPEDDDQGPLLPKEAWSDDDGDGPQGGE